MEVTKFYIEGIEYDVSVLDILSERESKVMQDKYIYNYTTEQIGRIMGITRERVRQIISKALKKIDKYLESNRSSEFDIIDETVAWLLSNYTLDKCGELVNTLMAMKGEL